MRGSPAFVVGFASFFKGFATIAQNRALWKWALIPLVISLIVFVLLVYSIAQIALDKIVLSSVGLLPDIEVLKTVTTFLVSVLASIAILLFSVFLTFVILRIIAGPFNGVLAERVLVLRGVVGNEPLALKQWVQLSLKMFIAGLRNGLIILVVGFVLFVLSFIPGLNLLTAFALALIASFEAADYSLEALRMDAKPRIDYFYRNIRYFSGFALALGLVFLIPGLNLLLFPVAVVGSSELVGTIEKAEIERRR